MQNRWVSRDGFSKVNKYLKKKLKRDRPVLIALVVGMDSWVNYLWILMIRILTQPCGVLSVILRDGYMIKHSSLSARRRNNGIYRIDKEHSEGKA